MILKQTLSIILIPYKPIFLNFDKALQLKKWLST